MNEKVKYTLKRIRNAGIAIGLILSLTACGNISVNPEKYNAPSNYTNESSYSSTVTSDYIDSLRSDEFKVYDEDNNTIKITLNDYNYLNFLNNLNSHDYNFSMSQYYGLEEALNLYETTEVNKSTKSGLLDSNGKLNADKLVSQVLKNNKEYMAQGVNSINTFYADLNTTDITKICRQIAEVVNSGYNNIEISKAANTLSKLTIFERTGSASNAYVTNDLTFVYNPTMTGMYADVQEIRGDSDSEEETKEAVITHEIMHLIEYAANDTNNENGIESGICRMYNVPGKEQKIVVDSLWNTWLLEAAAELGMADYLNIEPGTYAKKISYARSYNLSRFNETDTEEQALENVAFNHTLEEAFKDLELTTKEEQLEFLKYMYSVEITQTDPDEFWDNYTQLTGKNPTDTEKTEIRMNIRTDAVKYLSRNFYGNLIDAIHEQKITDLDTVFYLMRTWELDAYNHLEYTKTNSIEPARKFIEWQDSIHSLLFQTIAESNGLTTTDIEVAYDEYNLQTNINEEIANNCNLSGFNTYISNYITSAKENYSTTNFSKNKDVINYLTEKTNTSSTAPTTK